MLYNYSRKINIFSIGSTKTDFREMSSLKLFLLSAQNFEGYNIWYLSTRNQNTFSTFLYNR